MLQILTSWKEFIHLIAILKINTAESRESHISRFYLLFAAASISQEEKHLVSFSIFMFCFSFTRPKAVAFSKF